jgi:formate C-acetyltransferase
MLRSIAALDHRTPLIGSMFVIELLPGTLKGPEGGKKLWSLVRTAFGLGLPQCHFSCVDRETLRAAQEDPQRFGHVLVRVSGYSARFVDLGKELQDHIIARTAHTV